MTDSGYNASTMEVYALRARVEALEAAQLAMQSRMIKIAELCQKLATAGKDQSVLIRMLASHVGAMPQEVNNG